MKTEWLLSLFLEWSFLFYFVLVFKRFYFDKNVFFSFQNKDILVFSISG